MCHSRFAVNNFFICVCTATILVPSYLSRRDESNYVYGDLERSISFCDLRSRSKGDLTRSCCISFDASGQGEHFKTYPRSLSHSRSTKVNGLASRGHRSKKAVFERNLSPRITFSFLYVQQYRYLPSYLSRRDESNYVYGDLERSISLFDLRSRLKCDLTRSCCI